ncbi:hypothetical protein CLF_109883, partial [Clonorchis sinensis]
MAVRAIIWQLLARKKRIVGKQIIQTSQVYALVRTPVIAPVCHHTCTFEFGLTNSGHFLNASSNLCRHVTVVSDGNPLTKCWNEQEKIVPSSNDLGKAYMTQQTDTTSSRKIVVTLQKPFNETPFAFNGPKNTRNPCLSQFVTIPWRIVITITTPNDSPRMFMWGLYTDPSERQPLNDKNKTDPGNLGESLDPVYESVNPWSLSLRRHTGRDYCSYGFEIISKCNTTKHAKNPVLLQLSYRLSLPHAFVTSDCTCCTSGSGGDSCMETAIRCKTKSVEAVLL